MTLDIGSPAPDFTLPTDGGGSVTLSALHGRPVVLYFYPKDDTPGCTTESCDFRDAQPDFTGLGAEIIGLSKDSPASHDKFKAKHGLTFTLASDTDGKVCESYGVWVEKKNYGKTYMGIERTTVLIDRAGNAAKVWRKVKVAGHVAAVKEAVAAM